MAKNRVLIRWLDEMEGTIFWCILVPMGLLLGCNVLLSILALVDYFL